MPMEAKPVHHAPRQSYQQQIPQQQGYVPQQQHWNNRQRQHSQYTPTPAQLQQIHQQQQQQFEELKDELPMTITVQNIPAQLNTIDILSANFRRYGPILNVRVDPTAGVCYITFAKSCMYCYIYYYVQLMP